MTKKVKVKEVKNSSKDYDSVILMLLGALFFIGAIIPIYLGFLVLKIFVLALIFFVLGALFLFPSYLLVRKKKSAKTVSLMVSSALIIVYLFLLVKSVFIYDALTFFYMSLFFFILPIASISYLLLRDIQKP